MVEMTVVHAVAMKKAIEAALLQTIQSFEACTGLEVIEVRLTLRHEIEGNSHVDGVSLDVALP